MKKRSVNLLLFILAVLLIMLGGYLLGRYGPTFVPAESSQAMQKPTVYLTATGKCYHRKDCPTVHDQGTSVDLETARRYGYRACRVCMPPR